jgi:hypothetical protein
MQQDPNDPTGVSGQTGKGHGKSLASARARKANAAIQMRLAGATWHEIAIALGYPTERQACVATERALIKQLESGEDREKMRKLAGARLERLLRSAWPKAIDPDHPDQLLALTKCREVIADHRKLYGLDAPSEVVVHTPTLSELEGWVAQVLSIGQPQVVEYDILDGEVIEDDTRDAG